MREKNRYYRTQNTERKEYSLCENGFTLIEVMISMVVLLIGMLGVMAMQYYAVSGNATAREIRTATGLAQEAIEQLKGTPYQFVLSGSDFPFVNLNPGDAATDSTTTGGIAYARTWWVVPDCMTLAANPGAAGAECNPGNVPACAADPDAALVAPISAIRARTCWTDSDGATHFVTIDTKRWNENAVP